MKDLFFKTRKLRRVTWFYDFCKSQCLLNRKQLDSAFNVLQKVVFGKLGE